jgi:hypothetical protein
MDGTCSTLGREGKCIAILVGKLKEVDHLEDIGVDKSIMLTFF